MPTVSRVLLVAALGATAQANCASKFEDFVTRFGRVYSNPAERQARSAIFSVNCEFMEAENAKNHSYTLGVNGLMDQTQQEIRLLHGGLSLASTKPYGDLPFLGTHQYSGAQLPKAVDWTQKGAVTLPKNQGQCGSCWSFSTTGALEGALQIASGKLVSLSEQQLVDCSPQNHGCQGGLMDLAFSYLKDHAVCTENSYPYEMAQATCRQDKCTTGIPAGGVVGYHDVTKQSEEALMEAVAQQPVSVAIEADQMAFGMYKSGVLTKECGATLDHGVLVVGYGTDNGIDYWKVKNSWGQTWGEAGFLRIQRGLAGDGKCGIKDDASYPKVVMKSEVQPVVV